MSDFSGQPTNSLMGRNQIPNQTATIANAGTVSSTVTGGSAAGYGIVIPAAFTGTAITYQVSADNTTFQDLYDSTGATKISTSVTQGRSYNAPAELYSWPYWKIVSGSAEGGARSIVVVGKG